MGHGAFFYPLHPKKGKRGGGKVHDERCKQTAFIFFYSVVRTSKRRGGKVGEISLTKVSRIRRQKQNSTENDNDDGFFIFDWIYTLMTMLLPVPPMRPKKKLTVPTYGEQVSLGMGASECHMAKKGTYTLMCFATKTGIGPAVRTYTSMRSNGDENCSCLLDRRKMKGISQIHTPTHTYVRHPVARSRTR